MLSAFLSIQVCKLLALEKVVKIVNETPNAQ